MRIRDDRSTMQNGEQIELLDEEDGICRFTILDTVARGGNSICYTAEKGGYTWGRLKEFCPVELELSSNGTRNFGAERSYREKAKEYIGKYRRIVEIRRNTADNAILNNYIPNYEILRKPGEEGRPDRYFIFTPNDVYGSTIGDYVNNLKKKAENGDAKSDDVKTILEIITSVAEGIWATHKCNLYYTDITPSNLFVSFGPDGELNSGNISLFDLDSICDITDDDFQVKGTIGFCAPEQEYGEVGVQSDIYGIAALLYYCLTFEKYDYNRELDADGFGEDLERKGILRETGAIKNRYFCEFLKNIFVSGLANNVDERYFSCREIIRDIHKALNSLATTLTDEMLPKNATVKIVDTEVNPDSDPKMAMMNFLFMNPLYECTKEKNIEILLIGGGAYGRSFMDVCLQAQLLSKTLNITVCSKDMELDRLFYISDRKDLKEFVSFDGKVKAKGYGSISYKKTEKIERDNAETELKNICGKRKFHMAFVSIHNDELNSQVADILTQNYVSGPVGYAVYDNYFNPEKSDAIPVYVNDYKTTNIESTLNRVNFCMHFRNDKYKENYYSEWERFCNDRNQFRSSLQFSFAIPYKLYDLFGLHQAEDELTGFAKKISDEKYRNRIAEQLEKFMSATDNAGVELLAAVEHRRWNIEKITDGWSVLDYSDSGLEKFTMEMVARGSVNDKKRKLHPAIVPAKAEMELQKWTKASDWEKCDKKAYDKLDKLDKVSVDLHNGFKDWVEKHPDEYKTALKNNKLFKSTEIKKFITAFEKFLEKYQEDDLVVQPDNVSMLREREYRKIVKEAFVELTGAQKEALNKATFPYVQSILFKDMKYLDIEMIQAIPNAIRFKDFCPYTPEPEDLSDIDVETIISDELIEQLAKDHHEFWTKQAVDKGFMYGKEFSGRYKRSPLIVAYDGENSAQLSDEDKSLSREAARRIIQLLIKNGYRIDK